MKYRVTITDVALAAIKEQATYLAVEKQAPEAAERWLERVLEASDTLGEMPYRCAHAPENEYVPYEVRWLGVGSFVLLFTIAEDAQIVYVIGARHSRRLPQLDELSPELDLLDPRAAR